MRYTDPKAQSAEEAELSLRPASFAEYDVGQADYLRPLQVAIVAAQARERPLEHVLLTGPPGLGKTTLAYIIANEMGGAMHETSAASLKKTADLTGIVAHLEKGTVLFIDELHRLPIACAEVLYPVMEDSKLALVLGKAESARTCVIPLAQFTVIGATTLPGKLPPPLRDRFGLRVDLNFYRKPELAEIVRRAASALALEINVGSALEIARCARGTPRIAKRLLRRVSDYALVFGKPLTPDLVQSALGDLGIDEHGLDPQDRRYLVALVRVYGGGPAGVNAVASTLNVEPSTLAESVEPYLLRRGFIRRTSRGREVTDEGSAIVEPEPARVGLGAPSSVVTLPTSSINTLDFESFDPAGTCIGGEEKLLTTEDLRQIAEACAAMEA